MRVAGLVAAAALWLGHPLAITGLLNGVGETPAMGWSSWNQFRCDIDEAMLREVARSLVSTGLRDAGYRYLNVDDCWQTHRASDGHIQPDAKKFPSGMKALGDYVHSLGLRLGIYSDAGNVTCEMRPGSYGYEREDAADYAEWGVDYVKYDYCGMDNVSLPTRHYYERMSAAMNATGRPMVFSICSWGLGEPHQWGADVGHSWRTDTDLFAVWDEPTARGVLRLPKMFGSVMAAVERQAHLAPYARPGGFNDLDMLVVGLSGMSAYGTVDASDCPPHLPSFYCKPGQAVTREMWGEVGGLTLTEQRAHFSLWCMLSSPLMLGNDPRTVSRATLRILTAPGLIAISQDALAKQAERIWSDGPRQIWRKDLSDGSRAMLLFNNGDSPVDITMRWERDLREAALPWRRSVAREPPCRDVHERKFCIYTARSGRCDADRDFMLECMRTCRACQPALWNRSSQAAALVRDAWEQEDLGIYRAQFTAHLIEPHEARVYVVRFDLRSLEFDAYKKLAGRGRQARTPSTTRRVREKKTAS